MRSKYIINWLDDDFTRKDASIHSDVKMITSFLENKGFECCVKTFETYKDAESVLANKAKVDLFISDYNIDGEELNGLDFLKAVRIHYKKEMILYSNSDHNSIKSYVINNLKSGVDLNFFSKFTFESAVTPQIFRKTLKQVIEETLIRWEELNALRGLYLAEISQREQEIKDFLVSKNRDSSFVSQMNSTASANFTGLSLNKDTQKDINALISKIAKGKLKREDNALTLYNMQIILFMYNSVLFGEFKKARELRNGFAHINEDSTTESITLKDGTIIEEKDIYDYRRKLRDFLRNLDAYLTSGSYV